MIKLSKCCAVPMKKWLTSGKKLPPEKSSAVRTCKMAGFIVMFPKIVNRLRMDFKRIERGKNVWGMIYKWLRVNDMKNHCSYFVWAKIFVIFDDLHFNFTWNIERLKWWQSLKSIENIYLFFDIRNIKSFLLKTRFQSISENNFQCLNWLIL